MTRYTGVVYSTNGDAVAIYIDETEDFVYLDFENHELQKGAIIHNLVLEQGEQVLQLDSGQDILVFVDDFHLSLEDIQSYGFR